MTRAGLGVWRADSELHMKGGVAMWQNSKPNVFFCLLCSSIELIDHNGGCMVTGVLNTDEIGACTKFGADRWRWAACLRGVLQDVEIR